jgi:MoaA/NifB/PqqE/SkfB family radical SAM enzyme
MMSLTKYLSDSIDLIFEEAIRASIGSARERKFLIQTAGVQKKAAEKRSRSEREGTPVPPFLIASIATKCNLHCAGCYARANHACGDRAAPRELSAERWGELFSEAKSLGVSFILLAGGEPLERPDVLEEAAKTSGLIFPVFTNGTLLSGEMLDRFDRHRNLIPVVSIEGGRRQTDGRRGKGVFDLVARATQEMGRRGIFYGASVTVTKENLNTVSGTDFMEGLSQNGCRLVFFVEYVPVDGNTGLAPGENERRVLAERQRDLRLRYPNILFLSFPGDEKQLGGCLAAGRGFFHINSFGGAEPCPFSPYSDTSLRTGSLRQALQSALFRKIRESSMEAQSHVGGCVLFEKKAEVENLLRTENNPA